MAYNTDMGVDRTILFLADGAYRQDPDNSIDPYFGGGWRFA